MYKIFFLTIVCFFLFSCQNGTESSFWGNATPTKKPFYLVDFNKNMSKIPDDFFVMDGHFQVKKLGYEEKAGKSIDNWSLFLKPYPLNNYVMLFGPESADGLVVSVDVYTSPKGKTNPSFGVGSHGISGLKLLMSQNRGGGLLKLVYNETQVIATTPCKWVPDQWCRIQMKVVKTKEGVEVFGRSWTRKEKMTPWTLSYKGNLKIEEGQCSIIGIPYSGRDINFDNLAISKP
jgi:hypothetical protein